jgi:hypothetical protein
VGPAAFSGDPVKPFAHWCIEQSWLLDLQVVAGYVEYRETRSWIVRQQRELVEVADAVQIGRGVAQPRERSNTAPGVGASWGLSRWRSSAAS